MLKAAPLIILCCISFVINAQSKITDIIKPVNLIAGRPDSMLISDMFSLPSWSYHDAKKNPLSRNNPRQIR